MKKLQPFFVATALGFMAWLVFQQWSQIREIDFHIPIGLLILSLLGATLLVIYGALGWHLIIKSLDQPLLALESIRIWMVSSLTRYIPGGIWSYASRAKMAKEKKISFATSSVSMYLETLMQAASSFTMGLLALLAMSGYEIQTWYIIAMILAFSLSMQPSTLRLLHRLPGRLGTICSNVSLPLSKHLVLVFLYYLIFWYLIGLCFVLFASLFHPLPQDQWFFVGSSFALSYFLGFIVFFIPGGIGVRESALFFLLSPFMPETSALLVSIGSRVWLITAEFIGVCLIEATWRFRYPVSSSN